MRLTVWLPLVVAVAMGLANAAHSAIDPGGCDSEWREQPITQAFNYSNDIQPIWSQFCANCHVDHGGAPLAGLDLDPPFSYSNIVNAPNGDLSILLVASFDPAGSLVFRKINCDAPGPHPGGARMPLGRPPLSPAVQALLYDWIAAGAPLQLERLFAAGFESR